MMTMNDLYGDGSDCIACEICGFCITCGDCERYGCGKFKDSNELNGTAHSKKVFENGT